MSGGRKNGQRHRPFRNPRAEMLAARRRQIHHTSARFHEVARRQKAESGHVPPASLRRRHYGHALACPQRRLALFQRVRKSEKTHARGGRNRSRPRHNLRGDSPHAARNRRASSGGLLPQKRRADGKVHLGGHGSSRRRRVRSRRLCGLRRAAARRPVRRPHGLLLPRRHVSRLPPHGNHPKGKAHLLRNARRPAAHGRLLHGKSHGARFPAAAENRHARNQRIFPAVGGGFPQHRGSLH